MEYILKKDSTIGDRMKKIRMNAQLTQEQLADILGVSVNYLGEVERGRKPLSHSLAASFCRFFQITYDYLYNGPYSRFSDTIRESSDHYSSKNTLPGEKQIQLQTQLRKQIQNQLQGCSADELIVILRLINAFLGLSPALYEEYIQQDHDHRQDHTDPEDRSNDLS